MIRETKEERLARIREAWRPWQNRLNAERASRKRTDAAEVFIKAIERGQNKGKLKKLLAKQFWGMWPKLQSDAERLQLLINWANRFKVRVTSKRLRKMRKKYDRNKFHLLNIPDEKCACCPRKSDVRHHIIPLCVGGINSPLNLILICKKQGCNCVALAEGEPMQHDFQQRKSNIGHYTEVDA